MIIQPHTKLTLAIICFVLIGCSSDTNNEPLDDPLVVIHTQATNSPQENLPFRHVAYYRTEIHNQSDRPLKIVWFEGYEQYEDVWYPRNVLGRTLRGRQFSIWFTEGDEIKDGVIPPGGVAVCDANWHGGETAEPINVKWAFIAVDQAGNDYFVEAIVSPDVLGHAVNEVTSQDGDETE